MKTPNVLSSLKSLLLAGSLTLGLTASAKIFDGGVDSANLGKGTWVYFLSTATNQLGGNVPSVNSIPTLMTYFSGQGVDYIVVKAGTGSTNFEGQFTANLVNEAHNAGIKIFGYTRSYGTDIPGEVQMAADCYNMGADGFVFDSEIEWESSQYGPNGPTNAWSMLSQVKTNFPTKFLAHSPFMYIGFHSSFPYKEYGYWCDAVMPQAYWTDFGITPAQCAIDLHREWRNWHNGLTGQWTNSIKPIAPIGNAYHGTMPANEITSFVDALKAANANGSSATAGGYQSVSWWRADLHTSAMWTRLATNNLGSAMGVVNDIIWDNTNATYTATWSTGTSSADKWAADYRSRGWSSTGNHAQFRPPFWTGGNYQISEWHPQGSNRTTNAPHAIQHASGSSTVFVNQQVNGGAWNLLGTYNMAQGVGSYVRIRDNFTDAGQTVMADAIKFVYVAPSAPAAPSGLTAAAAGSSKINLSWTDNATTEQWYLVRRSTTSGGPYTTVKILAADSTSYSDTGLAGSTTYYYIVRAVNAGGGASSPEASATTSLAVADIIIDNPAASVTGSWSSGTGSADKFGTDYRFKSAGTGAAYLTYTPDILVAGDYEIYEWHPQGGNRSTGTPHEITYNGGTTTVAVNQQINGGQWKLLGTFNFATGTSGFVRIKDNISDAPNIIMADAIKFVFVSGAPPPPPAAPSGLTATAVSSSQINLAWNDNSNNETGFIVGRSTTSGGPYTDINTTAANATSFNNTGLAASTTYYYVVRARNLAGDSGNSNQASATTQSLPPPTAPSGLSATAVSSSQINLAWTDNSNNETAFIVGRSTTSGGPYSDIVTLGANVVSHNNTGLSASTTYYYVVRARNANGDSANSAQASATTQAPPPPAAPSGLIATAVSPSQIDLSWTDNSSDEDNFIVARSTTSGGPFSDIATLGAGVTSYGNTGLAANTTYYYVVRARGTGGDSANSAQASATTFQIAPPTAPSGLSAVTISQTEIVLSWTDNSSTEDSFVIARSTVSGGPYTDIATVGVNTTAYSNTGLAAGTTYHYVVRARNIGGDSANSAQASATTLPNPPTAPSGLTATAVSSSQINLGWSDNSSNEANFIVARSGVSGGPYTDIVTLGANVTSYSNTSLTPGTTYYYVVRARNTGGTSGNSNQGSATTPLDLPATPSNLSATAVRASQINLAWTDNSNNELNFIVARSTTAGGSYTDVETLAANTTTYNNTGLAADTTYYYVVRASNASGSSANSAEASATTYETDLLIDNKSATVVGVWSTGSASLDKYGADYRFIGQGTGANYLQFTPFVATAGGYEVYEWHPQGSNRPTNAPVVINYNGGTQTVFVNQEINGGTWVLLGTFNFAAGSAGNIRITDGFVDVAGQVVMADAIRLVAVPPPSAPGGLTATAFSASQINLNWTDNSPNETSFIVARSTVSGGPYSDIVTLSANTTSYANTGLAANTTYHYVVRAVNAGGSSPNSSQASATTFANQTTVTFTAVAAQDGWVLESGENTGVGGSISATASNASALRSGDNNVDRQYKTVVSFNTSSLPDGATIVSATLRLRRGSVTGTNPFNTHGTCHVDIKGGTGFGGANALATGDFQAAADATQVGVMSAAAANGDWSTGTINATGRGFVNKTGNTQFRVYFATDDNDDNGDDYIGWYSGDNGTAGNRPVLEIIYQ